jgi:hypothetical protein
MNHVYLKKKGYFTQHISDKYLLAFRKSDIPIVRQARHLARIRDIRNACKYFVLKPENPCLFGDLRG